mgnify:CR=1 FL=1
MSGFWDTEFIDGKMTSKLDVSSFVADMTSKMVAIEEELTRDMVIKELRKQGYTVIAPELGGETE